MAHKKAPKVTPESAKLNYEAFITEKAQEFSPMLHDAFPTESSLLIAIDNTTRFLQTANDTMPGKVTAEYFILHGPLSNYPDQTFALLLLFVATGVFRNTEANDKAFKLSDAAKWLYFPNKE